MEAMSILNKHGQAIGRKGAESRRRLLDATRTLIATEPAHKLTASAIARTAKLASQTFYLYFNDIDEILLALSQEAAEDMDEVFAELRSEEHTSELQSLMRISYAVFCLKKNKNSKQHNTTKTSE